MPEASAIGIKTLTPSRWTVCSWCKLTYLIELIFIIIKKSKCKKVWGLVKLIIINYARYWHDITTPTCTTAPPNQSAIAVQGWLFNSVNLCNINWRDVKRKNVVNNVDMSSLRAPWQNGHFYIMTMLLSVIVYCIAIMYNILFQQQNPAGNESNTCSIQAGLFLK